MTTTKKVVKTQKRDHDYNQERKKQESSGTKNIQRVAEQSATGCTQLEQVQNRIRRSG